MNICGIALGIVLSATAASAQEDLDGAIRALAEKLSKEGLSGKLAEALASDAGVQAVHEKIDFLLAAKISRFERDAVGHLEDYLFTVDATGDLHLRPERKPEIDALVKKLPLAARAMSGFSRRADDLVRRLGDGEMEKRAKAVWSDPDFRTAFFHRHPSELRELDEQEVLDAAGFRGLQRGADGKLRLAGPYSFELKSRMGGIFEQLETIKKVEKSYRKLVAAVKDDADRAALGTDNAALFLIGRVIRQVQEGGDPVIGGLTEADEDNKVDAAVTFNRELPAFLPQLKECEKIAAGLLRYVHKVVAEIDPTGPEELSFLEFIKNARARFLLAERILSLKEEQERRGGEIMNSVLEDGFEADGEKLKVKPGRYLDGDGKDSPDVLAQELHGVIEEFNGAYRQDFDRIAERCLDPGVIALFEDRPGTYLLQEFRDQVVERLADQTRRGGLDVFVQTYLVKKGEQYAVRPERAMRVEAILKRVADITAGK